MTYLKKSKKTYMSKKRSAVRRKTRTSRKTSYRSRPMPVQVKDSTVEKLNTQKIRPIYVKKMLQLLPQGAAGGANQGTQLNSFNPPGGSSFTFDPAGVLGNFSNGSPGAIQEWSAYAGLYQFYCVHKIKLIFSATGTTNGLFLGSPTIFIRYNNDYIPIAPTRSTMASMPGVVKKTFTAEHPHFEYSFYPKVQMLQDNYGVVLANESRVPRKMRMTNTATPVQLYGISLYWDGLSAGEWLNIDIEYDMSFKSAY